MHHMFNSPAPIYPGPTVSPYYCSWWAHSQCAVNIGFITLSTVQHHHTILTPVLLRLRLYQKLQPRSLQLYCKQPQSSLSRTQSCCKSSQKSAIKPGPTVLTSAITPPSPINMSSSTRAPLTDREVCNERCCNGGHKIMLLPDDENPGSISLVLSSFLDSPQLQSVNALHIVMNIFWVSEPNPSGVLQDAHNDRSPPQILQHILDRLKEVKAGRDRSSPLLRSLTLENPSLWRPNGRTNIKREKECLAHYTQMAWDAGVQPLTLKRPNASDTAYYWSR